MSDSKKKSIVKSITWQLVHVSFVAGVIYFFTGEWEYAGLGALVYMGWESTAYYLHERAWAKWGKKVI
jgi:uncharacterized membrane protein